MKRKHSECADSQAKKITIIGVSGQIGMHVLNELANWHHLHKKHCSLVAYNRDEKVAKDIASSVLDILEDPSREDEDYGEQDDDYVKIKGSNDLSNMKGSDLVIITAGISAGKTKQATRTGSLQYNIGLINDFGQALRAFGNPNMKVITTTNPVEQTSKLLQEVSGLPHENFFGSGTQLDKIRLHVHLQNSLRSAYNISSIHIDSLVLGKHSRNGMIFLDKDIKISKQPIADFLQEHHIDARNLSKIIATSELKVRTEGMEYVKRERDGRGAVYSPTAAIMKLAKNMLYPDFVSKKPILSAAIYTGNERLYNLPPCYIGLPFTFNSDGSYQVVRDGINISEKNMQKLHLMAQELAYDSTQVNEESIEMARKLNEDAKIKIESQQTKSQFVQILNKLKESGINKDITKLRGFSDKLKDLFELDFMSAHHHTKHDCILKIKSEHDHDLNTTRAILTSFAETIGIPQDKYRTEYDEESSFDLVINGDETFKKLMIDVFSPLKFPERSLDKEKITDEYHLLCEQTTNATPDKILSCATEIKKIYEVTFLDDASNSCLITISPQCDVKDMTFSYFNHFVDMMKIDESTAEFECQDDKNSLVMKVKLQPEARNLLEQIVMPPRSVSPTVATELIPTNTVLSHSSG